MVMAISLSFNPPPRKRGFASGGALLDNRVMAEPNRDFSSDNITPMAPEILAAIEAANHGTVHSYGDDPWTHRLNALANDVFERDVLIYPAATGTAANSLSLAAITPPFGGIFCHHDAHIGNDECGAPEFFTAGAKLIGLPGEHGLISPDVITPRITQMAERGIHQVKPAAISISQATEWGTVYTPAQITAIAACGLPLHMDGARFANALAHLGCTPAEATWKAGVDVLSFGATKNGALAAEAVVFFNLDMARDFEYRRKRAGQLFSKLRYASAQLAAYLENRTWLRHAAHANAMAARLAAGLPAGSLVAPVQANELFVALPEPAIQSLAAQGFGFYRWAAPAGITLPVIRLVTAWCTTPADVDTLRAAIAAL
jgi:threonine aldolase